MSDSTFLILYVVGSVLTFLAASVRIYLTRNAGLGNHDPMLDGLILILAFVAWPLSVPMYAAMKWAEFLRQRN